MGRIFFDLQRQLEPALRAGDLDACERALVSELSGLPASPFHIILDLSITNDAGIVAGWLDEFVHEHVHRFEIAAAYAEMNGFSVNTDLWFCNAFAYDNYGGHKDYDWLASWQSNESDILPIEGLEPLQDVFASDAFRNKNFRIANDAAELLVIIKFQMLMHSASEKMERLRCPLLATAHGSDFISEVRPIA